MARPRPRPREAISRVWITWFLTHEKLCQSTYRMSEKYLSTPALSILV